MGDKNEVLDAVLRELDGMEYKVEQGKHIKIRFRAHGIPRIVVVSRTTSDWLAQRNAVCEVRRILRNNGL